MRWLFFVFVARVVCAANLTQADELLYRYEGDVHILDPNTGWREANPCESPCMESVLNGSFRLFWPIPGDRANYDLDYDQLVGYPDTLWVEWRFRSHHPFGGTFDSCDARFAVYYQQIVESVQISGDAVLTNSGDASISGLELETFHTFRFES